MTVKKQPAPSPATDVAAPEVERILATLPAAERLTLSTQLRIAEAMETANALARDGARRETNAEAHIAEAARVAEEERDDRCATIRPARVRLAVPLTLDRCAGSPRVEIQCTGVGQSVDGAITLASLTEWATEPAEAVIRAECMDLVADSVAQAERQGDEAAAAKIRSAALGRGLPHSPGLLHRRWAEVHQKTLRDVIGSRRLTGRTLRGNVKESRQATLAELVEAGTVRIVGEPELGPPVDPRRPVQSSDDR
jgi:hypothetical protein